MVASCVGGPLPVLTWEWSAVVLSIRDNRFGTLCKRRQWIKSGKLLVGTGWSIHALHWGILRVTAAVVQLKQLFSKIFINEMIKDTVIKTYYHLKCWHNRKNPAVVYQDVQQLYILHKCITSHEMWKLNYRESYDEKWNSFVYYRWTK